MFVTPRSFMYGDELWRISQNDEEISSRSRAALCSAGLGPGPTGGRRARTSAMDRRWPFGERRYLQHWRVERGVALRMDSYSTPWPRFSKAGTASTAYSNLPFRKPGPW